MLLEQPPMKTECRTFRQRSHKAATPGAKEETYLVLKTACPGGRKHMWRNFEVPQLQIIQSNTIALHIRSITASPALLRRACHPLLPDVSCPLNQQYGTQQPLAARDGCQANSNEKSDTFFPRG